MLALLVFLAGLVLLTAGGALLVRAATLTARLAGLTPAVIGLTVVAAGTSMPELAVGLLAALRGEAELAVGNVVGSNIFNLTAALGLAALLAPLPVHGSAIRLEWPVMFLAGVAVTVLMRDDLLDRAEAAFLVMALVSFFAYAVRIARREVRGRERAEMEEAVAAWMLRSPRLRGPAAALGLLGGALLLALGGRLLVDAAVDLARLFGMSERLVGLTVVAAGTGMPELVTSLVAAARRRADIAVANMIGSNVFNLLGILGCAALARPLRFSGALAGSDALWMLGTSLLLLVVIRGDRQISRREGALLAAVYAAYLGWLSWS